MVMPYLRPCNDPDWNTVGDVVDFVHQMLEVSRSVLDAFVEKSNHSAGFGLHASASRSASVSSSSRMCDDELHWCS